MAAQTWTSLQQTLLVMLAQSPSPYNVIPPNFTALFPQATSYAEGRIYKDLVLLATRQQNTSLTTVGGARSLDLSTMVNTKGGPIIVPEGLRLIVPSGDQVPFDEASLDVVDLLWPNPATTATPTISDWAPRYWAMLDNNLLVMCPTPDSAYTAVITGLYQPTPISAANPSTYISTVYPELLEAACMVFLTGGLIRNFGAQAADPAMSVSWESQYQALKDIALYEEMRRRGLTPDIARPSTPPAAAQARPR